jgi:hypothetical protein
MPEATMDHADATARLADLALEPARLAALDTDDSAEATSLRAHIAGCRRCASEREAWTATWSAMTIGGQEPDDAPTAPASLRMSTLAAVAAEVRGAAEATRVPGRSRWRAAPWLVAAAALVIAVGAAGVGLDRTSQLDRVRAETAGLARATTALGQVLAEKIHWTTSLNAADGRAAGTVAWTAESIVVVADLPSLPAGGSYRCWVEQNGVRTPIGAMALSGSTGYWSAPMDGWGPLMGPGARFGVSIISADGSSTPVLSGTI